MILLLYCYTTTRPYYYTTNYTTILLYHCSAGADPNHARPNRLHRDQRPHRWPHRRAYQAQRPPAEPTRRPRPFPRNDCSLPPQKNSHAVTNGHIAGLLTGRIRCLIARSRRRSQPRRRTQQHNPSHMTLTTQPQPHNLSRTLTPPRPAPHLQVGSGAVRDAIRRGERGALPVVGAAVLLHAAGLEYRGALSVWPCILG